MDKKLSHGQHLDCKWTGAVFQTNSTIFKISKVTGAVFNINSKSMTTSLAYSYLNGAGNGRDEAEAKIVHEVPGASSKK